MAPEAREGAAGAFCDGKFGASTTAKRRAGHLARASTRSIPSGWSASLSVPSHLRLEICGRPFTLKPQSRIVAVGAGKAGAGMAAGLEAALAGTPLAERLTGWVNVPADCVRPLDRIHLHAARPAGVNEPTAEGVAGAEEILRRVGQLSADDLCLILISGGASALLPAPAPGLSLADKLAVTRLLERRRRDY